MTSRASSRVSSARRRQVLDALRRGAVPESGLDLLAVGLDRRDLTPAEWRAGMADAPDRLCLPEVDEKASTGLKFNTALPQRLALATLATRLADLPAALSVLREPSRFTISS